MRAERGGDVIVFLVGNKTDLVEKRCDCDVAAVLPAAAAVSTDACVCGVEGRWGKGRPHT